MRFAAPGLVGGFSRDWNRLRLFVCLFFFLCRVLLGSLRYLRSHHLYFIFLSRVKINSINWPAPNIWVFIAQLVEHCSANAEAMGSNPVEALKFFSGLNLQLLKLRLQLRWSNLYFVIYFVL